MKKVLFIALSVALFMVSCGGATKQQEGTSVETNEVNAESEEAVSNQIKLTIASEQVDCTGVGPQKCFLIKKEGETDWNFWYSGIREFNYEPGFEYVIEVKVEKVENVPADASSIIYTFVQEISKTQKQSENMPNIPSVK